MAMTLMDGTKIDFTNGKTDARFVVELYTKFYNRVVLYEMQSDVLLQHGRGAYSILRAIVRCPAGLIKYVQTEFPFTLCGPQCATVIGVVMVAYWVLVIYHFVIYKLGVIVLEILQSNHPLMGFRDTHVDLRVAIILYALTIGGLGILLCLAGLGWMRARVHSTPFLVPEPEGASSSAAYNRICDDGQAPYEV